MASAEQHSTPSRLAEQLSHADAWCRSRGERLTERRREILALLLMRGRGIKAYELLQELQKRHPKAGPTSVYRPLHFLIANGLVSRVPSLNSYVASRAPMSCSEPGFMLVCAQCAAVDEISDPAASELLRTRLQREGYRLRGTKIEVKAVCPSCVASPGATASAQC